MRCRLCIILLWLAASAAAQRGNPIEAIELNVHISLPQGTPAQNMLMVELMTDGGGHVAQVSTADGSAVFEVKAGFYRLRITGTSIEDYSGETINISAYESNHQEFVQVRPRRIAADTAHPGGVVSSAELHVPQSARDAYTKGNEALGRRDPQGAIPLFEKAISIYPKYANAHGALGLALLRTGDRARARQEFLRSVELDKTLETAYLNLGKLSVEDHQFADAEHFLVKATALSPNDPEAIAYLADADFFQNKYDDVIAMARRLHAQNPHHRFAMLHFLAANALERSGRAPESAAEYRLFLQEDPENRRAPLARQALSRVQK